MSNPFMLYFITAQRLSAAAWWWMSPAPALWCVWQGAWYAPLPLQGDGVGRSFITSYFPVTYYSSGQDNWQDVYRVMSNSLSLAAPNLLFGCRCHIISISYQGKRSAERKSWQPCEEVKAQQRLLLDFHLQKMHDFGESKTSKAV